MRLGRYLRLVAAVALTSASLQPLGCIPTRAGTTAASFQRLCTDKLRSGGQGYVPAEGERDDLILKLICAKSYVADSPEKDNPYRVWHGAFDDRHFDPVRAAMIVVHCAGTTWCRAPYNQVPAYVEWYAQETKPEAVTDGLAQSPLDAEVKKEFVDRYVSARQHILTETEVKKSSREAVILFEAPQRARQARKAYFAKFAKTLETLETTLEELKKANNERRGEAELLKRAVALRDSHVLACIAEKSFSAYLCWHGTIVRQLTRAIAWQAIYAKDALTADTEVWTLEQGKDVHTAAAQISMAQYHVRHASTGWDPWRFPGPSDAALQEEVKKLGEGLYLDQAPVASVSRSGMITFDPVDIGSTSYSCGSELHLRQTTTGDIQVYRRCSVASQSNKIKQVPPITVPSAEAEAVKRGQIALVRYETTSHRGRVWQTLDERSGQVGRFRMTPVTPADASDAAAASATIYTPR